MFSEVSGYLCGRKALYESEIFSTAPLCWFGTGPLCFQQLALCIVTIPWHIQQEDGGFWRHNKRVSPSFCTLHFSVQCLMCTIGQYCFSCLNPSLSLSLSLSLTSSPSLIAAVAAVALADHRRERREWKELGYLLNAFPKGLTAPTSPVLLTDFLYLFIPIYVELFHIWNPSK